MAERRFPVLLPYSDRRRHADLPKTVPWSVLEPHTRRVLRNHYQSLGTLAARGGLSPLEMWLIVHDKPLTSPDGDLEGCTQTAAEWLRSVAAQADGE